MDALVNSFLDKLIQSQFADLKGSSATFTLQLPEKLLNELASMALASQKQNHPWLALVNGVKITGGVKVELSLKA